MYYQCTFCGTRREIEIDPQDIKNQIEAPMSNGLATVMDIHNCINDEPIILELTIDADMNVRAQEKVMAAGVVDKQLQFTEFNIPIPGSGTVEVETSKSLNITSLVFNGEFPYIHYIDENNNIEININIKNKTTDIRVLGGNTIKLETTHKNELFDKWMNTIIEINEIMTPKDSIIAMLQILYAQDKIYHNEDITAYDYEFLVHITYLSTMRIRLSREDARDVFNAFGKGIFKKDKAYLYEEAKNIFQYLSDKPTTVSSLQEKTAFNFLHLVDILMITKHYYLIELDFD